MSDTTDTRGPEPDLPEAEALAAEYVLGVLDETDRLRVGARMVRDRGFARRVEEWEARLAGLNDGYADERVPRVVKTAIDARLFGVPSGSDESRGPVGRFLGSIWLWRTATAAALLAVAGLLVQDAVAPPDEVTFVLDIRGDTTDDRFVAIFDETLGAPRIVQTEGPPADGSYQMWILDRDGTPVSLGVIDSPVGPSPEGLAALRDGATVAVSREPEGGSPTGQPTEPFAHGVAVEL